MRLFAVVLLICLVPVPQAASAANAQQDRMKACNETASKRQLAGDPHRAFMKSCLAGRDGLTPQQQKMQTCNAEAGTRQLRGEARQGFMKKCLGASQATTP